ncbi:MAG: hypothetical protein ABI644_03680 [Arenimonas sp.]
MNRKPWLMNTRMKYLDCTLISILGTMSAGAVLAQEAAIEPVTQVQVQSMGEAESKVNDKNDLQHNRRVDIKQIKPVQAPKLGRAQIELPNGGLIWATEDPQLSQPELNISANSIVAFAEGKIQEPVSFFSRTNYVAFMKRIEISVYRGTDSDYTEVLAKIDVPLENVTTVQWDGALPSGLNLRQGDYLIFVARAYDDEGHFDETQPQRMQLVRPEDIKKQQQGLVNSAGTTELGLSASQIQARQLLDQSFSSNGLRQQNIRIYGSRVRVRGEDIAEGAEVKINGQSYPVDQQRKFVAEYLVPVGTHHFDVEIKDKNQVSKQGMDVAVSGRYMFMVALADVTLSDNSVSGSVVPAGTDDKYDGFITEGRLAFYLKGKIKGKYLVTAQADTHEQEISRLFNGFLDSDPRDVFRRLDPDQYYPVYGDDSTTYRDVDTQGRLYVRVDWDKSQAIWGNFSTGFTGTEFGQYSRSLYGAALSWRSPETTTLGDPKRELRGFAANAQSAYGHTEFLGTGGSLYYLHNTDLLPGSQQVVLEVRDTTTGRVETRANLVMGADYEIDELQGRLILTRPLAQIVRDNLPSIIRDQPLDGFENRLLVDYEYIPSGFNSDEMSTGGRGKVWLGNHVAIGATYVDENRAGDDYQLQGADLTLQAGRGTYLKLEQARSQATSAPVFYSDNGGLSFTQTNPLSAIDRQGDAQSIEARANFKELGWTEREWTAGAWWRSIDPGFSVSRSDTGLKSEEQGFEFAGNINDQWRLTGRYSDAKRGTNEVEQSQMQVQWRPNANAELTGEVRRVTDTNAGISASGTLAAIRYGQRVNPSVELYGVAQVTLDDDNGNYANNDAYTAGAKYTFGNLSSVGAEYTTGDRGDSARINAEYRLSPEHSIYGAYTYSTDVTTGDTLFDNQNPTGITLGQRWRISNQVNVFNESQFLKTPNESGLAHTFGLDFYPSEGWTTGFTLQHGELENVAGIVNRNAYSVSGGYTDQDMSWNSKLEYRRDTGVEERKQWVGTNRLSYKVNDDWRLAARLNFGNTEDLLDPSADAKFIEGNFGFSYRPAANDRWNVLGRYTYLYDLTSFGQETLSDYDQRSQILSFEGIYRATESWEFAGKVARRHGEARLTRASGPWFDSTANFWAAQARYQTTYKWDGLIEYRWLNTVEDDGTRQGWLIGVDRHISQNFRVGVGYNFTQFSDQLTSLDFDHKGFFLNFTGVY